MNRITILRRLCAENFIARWYWKSGELKSNSLIPWETVVYIYYSNLLIICLIIINGLKIIRLLLFKCLEFIKLNIFISG
jgi:hypothetical protein